MPDLLLIGGTGFLSGTIAQQALASGYRVWTLTRGQRPVVPGVVPLIADRHDDVTFSAAIQNANVQWDLAVDCIGYRPEDIQQDVQVLSPLVKHLIIISTDFVYDPARRRFPQGEETDAYLTDGYGGLKCQCELALMEANSGSMQWTVLRPCHIYGPGSALGCLPMHSRDANLITRLRAGEPLQLVGGGHFLQQPILARDLVQSILSLRDNAATFGQIFCIAGPEIVESRQYYRLIADILGVELRSVEIPIDEYLSAHPEAAPFLCHRIYDLQKLRASGAEMPKTPLVQGLREHVASLL